MANAQRSPGHCIDWQRKVFVLQHFQRHLIGAQMERESGHDAATSSCHARSYACYYASVGLIGLPVGCWHWPLNFLQKS